jgi:hypothetical protein
MPIDGESLALGAYIALVSDCFYPQPQIARAPLALFEMRVGGLCKVRTRTY